jgi:beta-glucanase (GH16 family)
MYALVLVAEPFNGTRSIVRRHPKRRDHSVSYGQMRRVGSVRVLEELTRTVWRPCAIVGVAALLSACSYTQSPSPTVSVTAPTPSENRMPNPAGNPSEWNLVLDSTFAGTTVDLHIWRAGWFGTGDTSHINAHELACYSSANVTMPGDGTVNLAVTGVSSTCGGHSEPFTAAILSSNPTDGRSAGGFQYRYGLLEARVYFPSVEGEFANWPVVMTLGHAWPADGEDDIAESLAGRPCFAWHFVGHTAGFTGCDLSMTPGWHTVAADWESGTIRWYYDGRLVGMQTKGVTDEPMYVVLLNTVRAGEPATTLPSVMKVAYVKVWQKK